MLYKGIYQNGINLEKEIGELENILEEKTKNLNSN